MEIIVILVATGSLAFLGRVGFIIYEVLSMDFDFNRPWPQDVISTNQVQESKASVRLNVRREKEVKELTVVPVS